MAWLFLLVAGAFEIGFTTCLRFADGFKNAPWTAGFFICASLSFVFLDLATRNGLPLGTAYAVWTGIGIAGTWSSILVTHLAFLKRVKAGKEQRTAYRMPGAPFTDYLALAFFAIVVISNLTSASGRWTLALFAVVVVAMIIGWYAVRGRIDGSLMDEILDNDEDEDSIEELSDDFAAA